MKESNFLKRLRRELPLWVQNGWVLETRQQDILNYVEKKEQQTQTSSTSIFVIFGALLFATGVISFFAANWDIIPKLVKIFILFAIMWGAYFISYVTSRFASVFLLLGSLLFGANIWLIAQIYHIEVFYPSGVLAWSLGALLVAIALRNSLTLALSISLGVLWTGLYYYTFNFRGIIHWEYLILWLVQIIFVIRLQKPALLNLAILSLIIWSLFSISGIQFNLYFLQLYILLACTLYFIGILGVFIASLLFKKMNQNEAIIKLKTEITQKFARSLQHWGLFLIFSTLYILAIPQLIHDSHFQPVTTYAFYPVLYSVGISITLLVILINVVMLIGIVISKNSEWIHSPNRSSLRAMIYFGLFLYLFLNILILSTLLGATHLQKNSGFFSILFNIIYFAGTLWLIQVGNQIKDSFTVNLGCVFFALGLITRYFDTFWTLLDRSFFFMLGGLLLLSVSFVIEKYRRFFIKKINENRDR